MGAMGVDDTTTMGNAIAIFVDAFGRFTIRGGEGDNVHSGLLCLFTYTTYKSCTKKNRWIPLNYYGKRLGSGYERRTRVFTIRSALSQLELALNSTPSRRSTHSSI